MPTHDPSDRTPVATRLEREIKLRFDGPAEARAAVLAAGGAPIRDRRLQQDSLLDSADGRLRGQRLALRVRIEAGRTLLTFKGPVQPSSMKLREELETVVGDASVLLRMLEAVGFRVWFRYEKYREEFALGGVLIAVDETPVGTFVELEGSEQGITTAAERLGRGPADFVIDSYRSLYLRDCERRGVPASHMLFDGA